MRSIALLDCTLRDGGYVNNWSFGFDTIRRILQKFSISKIEYVECGYLSEFKGGDRDSTQYRSFDDIRLVMPVHNRHQYHAVMIDFGQYLIEHIPKANENDPIIRVCFHKKDSDNAMCYCGQLIEKGYTVFVQPMVSMNYSDSEFLGIIEKTNEMSPACFYIVDSFGAMEIEDFQRILALAEHNLSQSIMLGYHSHNNLQQAYGNAKYMLEQNLQHDIIIDSSVYGMGRGAGNLNTELFASYLNKRFDKHYDIDAILDIMDEYIKPIFAETYWGYSLPFYLSARFNCHPNYAGYFADKNTLSNKSMKYLLASLPEHVKNEFSLQIAEECYQAFQENYINDTETVIELRKAWESRDILILAPGRKIVEEAEKIQNFIDEKHPVIISVNVVPAQFECEYMICTNEKRLKRLKLPENCKLILTSNLRDHSFKGDVCYINYSSYLTSDDLIADNPTLMLLNMMINMGIEMVYIAGFDGYSTNPKENYYDETLSLGTSINVKLQKNEMIRKKISEFKNQITITFVTTSIYQSNT